MLNLFDYLTEEDNRKINNYVCSYGIGEHGYCGNEEYLRYWAECKPKLFHLLGGQLIYKIPYKYEFSEDEINIQLRRLSEEPFFDNLYWKLDKVIEDSDDLHTITGFYSYTALKNDAVSGSLKIKLPTQKRTLQIQVGMKPMKALQKIIAYFLPDDEQTKEAYEKIRIKHSMIFNEKCLIGNLCLSIHPLDFMTMSDNASSWQSCMSWVHKGCYRIGTVEMMNSNNVICAYLESKVPFEFGTEGHEDSWNSKKWRQLFYCTKEIMVGGKAYPFQNYDITKRVLAELRMLAEKNWHHTYEFGIEEYMDMTHIGTSYRMDVNRKWIRYGNTKKHNIIFDTKGMYNDMLNDHEPGGTKYFCIRNKVKQNTIISYSGKAPCLCCGESVLQYDPDYEDTYNDRYTNTGRLICEDCETQFKCHYCGYDDNYPKIVATVGGYRLCQKCYDEHVRVCPDCGQLYTKEECAYPVRNGLFILLDDSQIFESRCIPNSYHNWGIIEGVDEDGYPFKNKMISYQCCPECAKKLTNEALMQSENSLFEYKRINSPYDWQQYGMYVTKKVYAEDDPLVVNHLTSGLKRPEGDPQSNS